MSWTYCWIRIYYRMPHRTRSSPNWFTSSWRKISYPKSYQSLNATHALRPSIINGNSRSTSVEHTCHQTLKYQKRSGESSHVKFAPSSFQTSTAFIGMSSWRTPTQMWNRSTGRQSNSLQVRKIFHAFGIPYCFSSREIISTTWLRAS